MVGIAFKRSPALNRLASVPSRRTQCAALDPDDQQLADQRGVVRPTSLLYSRVASMARPSSRPFYGEYAWAFDLLIDRPVRRECAAITAWLIERGVLPGATLLDAGCGTGRYAGELARRGYAVTGVDRSSELIETARRSVRCHGNSVSFRVGEILNLPEARYDCIVYHGVLVVYVNDVAT